MAESSFTSLENDCNTKVTDSSQQLEFEGANTKDSDEVFEMYCETCNRDGIHVTAYAFCVSCVAYFCSTCLKYHGKFLLGHKYLEGDKMPLDICIEICKTHNNEIIKFYCATCSKFVCSVCKTEDHADTCSMKYLPDIVNKDLENGEYLKELMTKKNDLAKRLTDTKTEIDTKYERIKSTTAEARSTITKEMEALLAEFDEEVFQIEEKIQSEKTNDNVRVDTAKENFDTLAVEIEKLSNDMNSHLNSPKNQKYKLFFKLIQCSDALSKVKDTVEGLTKGCCTGRDTFESDVCLLANDLTESVNKFGALMRSQYIKFQESEKQQKKTAYPERDINVRAEGDFNKCRISDCCMLSEQFLIVCDKNNTSLKLVDTKLSKLVYVRPLKSTPETITKINDTELAIVQSHDKDEDMSVIQFLTLTKAKTLAFQKRHILTEMKCYTIVYIGDGRLIISMSLDNEGKVQILNMKGKVLANIKVNKEGNEIFKNPYCIALDAEAKYAYVSDWYKDSIIEIDLGNNATRVIACFWHPEGITTDKEGFVYIIESGTNRIHCFHPKDGFVDVTYTQKHLLLDKLYGNGKLFGIYYSVTDNKLYVGYYDHDCIQVYRINNMADSDKEVKKTEQ